MCVSARDFSISRAILLFVGLATSVGFKSCCLPRNVSSLAIAAACSFHVRFSRLRFSSSSSSSACNSVKEPANTAGMQPSGTGAPLKVIRIPFLCKAVTAFNLRSPATRVKSSRDLTVIGVSICLSRIDSASSKSLAVLNSCLCRPSLTWMSSHLMKTICDVKILI